MVVKLFFFVNLKWMLMKCFKFFNVEKGWIYFYMVEVLKFVLEVGLFKKCVFYDLNVDMIFSDEEFSIEEFGV